MALQLIDQIKTIVSSDVSSTPVQLAFSEALSITDNSTIVQYEAANQTYSVAAHVLPMGSITAGKFVWVYPLGSADVALTFNGGSDLISFVHGKPTKMYVNFTSITLTVSGSPQQVQLFYGGT